MNDGERDLLPLRRFLREPQWPQRITTYDMYGGVGMTVMLEPPPSAQQLHELHAKFGDAYAFDTLGAYYEEGRAAVGERRASTEFGVSTGLPVEAEPPGMRCGSSRSGTAARVSGRRGAWSSRKRPSAAVALGRPSKRAEARSCTRRRRA